MVNCRNYLILMTFGLPCDLKSCFSIFRKFVITQNYILDFDVTAHANTSYVVR